MLVDILDLASTTPKPAFFIFFQAAFKMGLVLGKRKRRRAEEDGELSTEDAHAIFKRHFEARFKPLVDGDAGSKPTRLKRRLESEAEDEASSESEWEGVSDEEDGMYTTIGVSSSPEPC